MTLAVVTGANRGIGLAIASGLALAGHHVVMTGRSRAAIEVAATQVNADVTGAHGTGSAEAFVVDVVSDDDVGRLAGHVASLGPLGIVVNNAGVYLEAPHLVGSAPNAIVDQPIQVFRDTMEVNLYGPIRVIQALWPLMTEGGTILTLTFQGSNQVMPFYNVMGVAKAALESTVRYLANDLGPDGIRVNAISPGPMKTLAGAAIGGARKTFRETEENAPLRANATLEAVGGTAVYLASDYGASTTGEIVHVDGGYHVLGMAQPDNL